MHLTNKLLDYQENAVEKLKKVKVGALFMEQGTGKTITALELCRLRLEAGKVTHILWLCPCSTKQNLKDELIKQSPREMLEKITICGIDPLSRSLHANSYLQLLTEREACYLVVDESLLIKNPYAYRTQNIDRLSSRCEYKLILNGMPISKNQADLYAQFHVLDWRILGYKTYWSFAANHIEFDPEIPQKIIRCLNTDYLARKISPYTVQVTKKDCLVLPDKRYTINYFPLTPEQNAHYNSVADTLLFHLNEMHPETIYRLFSGLQAVTSGFRVNFRKSAVSGYEHIVTSPFFAEPTDNPRLQRLLTVLDNRNKYIIFCNYTYEIDVLCEILSRKYGPENVARFDGSLPMKKRLRNLEEFRESATFLIANRDCAGYSLNLQFCHNIIYYSNGWDLATRLQSEDRIHRIGQDQDIRIRDICAYNTLDERILSCLYRKEKLLEAFRNDIKNMENKNGIAEWVFYRQPSRSLMDCDDLEEPRHA